VDLGEVVQRNALLSLSISLLNPLEAQLRRAPQIDNCSEGTVLDEFLTDSVVYLIFRLLHVPLTVHDLPKDVAVGKRRPLGKV
jgi:hypothetical protein